MGAAFSNESRPPKKPEDIAEFRKLTGPTDHYVIPELPEKRKVTDFKFTVTFAVCIGILVPFLIYTFVYSDIDRFLRGYDNCGDICGEKNSAIDNIACSGKDNTDKPFLMFLFDESRSFDEDDYNIKFECVESCDSSKYTIIQNRCIRDEGGTTQDVLAEISNDLNRSAGSIVALCFIGLGFCIGMLLLFRYFVAVVVWVILVGSILGIIILTGALWVAYKNVSELNANGLLYLSLLFTVISIVLVIMLIVMFKRIKLVIRLFKESIKIIFAIPLILLEPLLTFLAVSVLLIIWAFFLLVWSTAGTLEAVGYDMYRFEPNGAIVFTIFYHCIICLWMIQFIVGCQHMVIAGAVSAVYFARNKSAVVSPIYYSFYNLVRYHLGTVAFGSLIITIIAVIKALIRSLASSRQAKILVDCCLGAIEDFLKYLSKNAYIQTAMHGQPFYKSGKRAVRLLYANAISTIAVNSVGDFVLYMAKLLIVVCTIGVGMLMYDDQIRFFGVAIAISAIVTAIIADCFFAVYETAVDTLFLCFCEDSCLNDGMERPYYMTTEFMQYMDDAKKTIKDKNVRN